MNQELQKIINKVKKHISTTDEYEIIKYIEDCVNKIINDESQDECPICGMAMRLGQQTCESEECIATYKSYVTLQEDYKES